jgi:hypothetical protein
MSKKHFTDEYRTFDYTTNGLKPDPSGKPLPVNGERL